MKTLRQRGFTLIEVAFALFILTFVLLSMCTMVYSVIRAAGQSREIIIANTLLQDQMELLKNTPYASLTSGSDSPLFQNVTYARRWFITPSNNLTILTVTVSWNDRVPRSATLTTYRAESK